MIWIFSYARSGSTLILDFLAKLFEYNRIFEPFMEEPEKVRGHRDFKEVHNWFRGAPKVHLLPHYKIGEFYLGRIPVPAFDSVQIATYKAKLKNYIKAIYDNYGSQTIVKCVRQQGNIKFIQSILEELGIEAGFIFLKRNPFEIAYSYYRMGGFHKRSSWSVNQVFQYRKCMYHGESDETDMLFARVKNPLDKLVVAILADYKAFDESLTWLKEHEIKALNLNYEDMINHTVDNCHTTASYFKIPLTREKILKTVEAFSFNPAKLNSSRLDPVYAFLCQRTAKNLALTSQSVPVSEGLKSLELWHTKCLLKNILPFIKVS
ncbi:sulfotransferase domain-containing protein [candidate division CSSED10-310 bacterium]|uniref:Sulfotransferase domain-containing protein n=1 Tax=candidate division CSSED10-310 bacterium TaxID=2855610 RepID=A0ABV6YZ48_UNCC1